MIRQLKVKAVSYKSRGVLVEEGGWLNAGKELDLKDLRIGETYPLDISQRLDGEWVIHKIEKGEGAL